MNTENSKAFTENGESSPMEEANTEAVTASVESADTDFSETSDKLQKAWKTSENTDNAKRRRDEERQKRAIREARESGIIEAIGGLNPYTGETVSDSRDVDEYLAMREIEKEGGDPLTDFARYQKKKQKLADEALAKEEQLSQWIDEDREKFIAKYPDVNLSELIADESFRSFADGKTGNVPLAEIYEGYTTFVEKYEKQVRARAAQLYANSKASPGALGGAVSDGGFFTPEQVRAMSREEVRANFDAIKQSMKKWK